MSRQNKVNPNHYTMAGRLTPDDLARERKQQAGVRGGTRRSKPMAPWMTNEAAEGARPDRQDAEFDLAASEGAPLPTPAEKWPAETATPAPKAPPAARKAAPKPERKAAPRKAVPPKAARKAVSRTAPKAAPKAARKAAPKVARKAARKPAPRMARKAGRKTSRAKR